MATEFTRPTLLELFARAKADIEGAVTGITAALRRRVEYALAFAVAAAADSLHGHLQWNADQIFPDTQAERNLLRTGSLYGVTRNQPARAAGSILATGTGGTIPLGTQYVRQANGRKYETTAAASSVVSSSVPVRALDGGVDGDVDEGETLTLVSPIANVNSAATVQAGGISNGTDLETLDAYLLRVLERIRRPIAAGAPGDYVTWAKEVPGVTRAWEYAGVDGMGNEGAGKVTVLFVLDDDVDIIPDSAKVAEVQAYLDERSPAQVFVLAPTPVEYNYTVALKPNTPAVQQAVDAEVRDMLRRDANPGGTIFGSRADEAISAATGELDHALTSPAGDKTHAFGQMAVAGTGTFTTL